MSDICKCYAFEIKAPVEIRLTVEMTAGGLVDHIAGETFDDIDPADDLRVRRAVLFLTPILQGLEARGDLIEDAARELPVHTDFNIERSIMIALGQLQKQVLGEVRIRNRRGAA